MRASICISLPTAASLFPIRRATGVDKESPCLIQTNPIREILRTIWHHIAALAAVKFFCLLFGFGSLRTFCITTALCANCFKSNNPAALCPIWVRFQNEVRRGQGLAFQLGPARRGVRDSQQAYETGGGENEGSTEKGDSPGLTTTHLSWCEKGGSSGYRQTIYLGDNVLCENDLRIGGEKF